MNRRVLGVVLGVIAALVILAGVISSKSCRSHRDATVASGSGGGASSASGTSTTAMKKGGPVVPASLAGRVTRASDGAGIAGAVVTLAPAELMAMFVKSNAPTRVAVTDATGAWKATGVPPGSYVVAASATGYLPASKAKLLVGGGEQKSGVDIALTAGGTVVSGTVADVGGGPIASARVTATIRSDIPDARELWGHADYVATTDASGHYSLTLADGMYEITATHDEYTEDEERAEVKGQPVTLDFTLIPGAVVRGQVVARDSGAPVPGALVRAEVSGRGGDGSTIADGDGNFTMRSLGAGAIELSAMGRGYASQTPTSVAVGIGEQVDGVRIVVERAYSISGRVVRKGKPDQALPGVTLGAFSIAAKSFGLALEPSSANGSFEIVGLRPASYIVGAVGEGSVPEVGKNVEIVDKDVDGVIIEMAAGVTISGRVEPAMTRVTISIEPSVPIGLANMFDAVKSILVRGETDETGAFTLKSVPAGAFKLSAMAPDGHAGSMPLVVAEADQTGVVIKLEARASISGRVVDTNGKPVPGTRVRKMRQDDDHHSDVNISFGGETNVIKTGPDGTFKFVGLEAGKYTVRAGNEDGFDIGDFDKDGTPLVKKAGKDVAFVELTAATEKTGVQLEIEARDGVIRGNVLMPDKKPAADAWVTAYMTREPPPGLPAEYADSWDRYAPGSTPVLTSPDGQFTIGKLRKGAYKLVVEGPRGATHAEKSGIKTGDSVTIQLASLGTLTGKVTASGKPVAKYEISCASKADDTERSIDDKDGAYTLERLAPGNYTCNVTSDAGSGTGKVEVPAGTATFDFALTPWATITGTVVSVLDGKPVPNLIAFAGNTFAEQNMANVMLGKAPTTDATGRFTIERVAEGKGTVALMPKDGGFTPLGSHEYTATAGQRVDVGIIKIIPPRTGDAGTYGFSTNLEADKLVVTSVKEGGPAAAAGIAVGDTITAINGRTVKELTPLTAQSAIASGTVGVGVPVQLAIDRGGTAITASLTSVKW